MIVVTAGHVDHGKTSLVKSLTGVDTDRLPEEKKRGMSIDLGFAFMSLPIGADPVAADQKAEFSQQIAFVDVPGHEKFVRNMIAGVSAVDAALLVIAADDGPMPQTVEHLAILQLLKVPQAIVVVSKADLVDVVRLSTVHQEIASLLEETNFVDAPVFDVSINDPASIDRVRDSLSECLGRAPQSLSVSASHPHNGAFFRMSIDRQFSITGAGTVVTGTVTSGEVEIDSEVFALSTQVPLRVRGIHAQNKVANKAVAGQRCALNLAGSQLKKARLQRGEWLGSNQQLQPVRFFDVSLTPSLRQSVLKHWTPAHLHVGASDIPCRIALLETEQLAHGESAYARIICDKPAGVCQGDHFVLRDQSARHTIAGGTVIDPLPPRRGRARPERLAILDAMHQPTRQMALQQLLNVSEAGVSLNILSLQFNLSVEMLMQYIADANDNIADNKSSGEKIVVTQPEADAWAINDSHWRALQEQVQQSLLAWHEKNTDALGADVEQLRRSVSVKVARPVLVDVLRQLCAGQAVSKRGAVYRLVGQESSLGEATEQLWTRLLPFYQQNKPVAPRVVEIAEYLQLTVPEVLSLLNTCVAHGRLYRVSDNRYFLPEDLYQLAVIAETLGAQGNFTVAGYRDESGIGRNLVIELLEFFDRLQFTRRLGQQRTLLQTAEQVFKD